MISIREEQPGDFTSVLTVNQIAFEGEDESQLVAHLRVSGCPRLSLVATDGDTVVGHILFSKTELVAPDGSVIATGMGLAPMAVLPNSQRQGVGRALIEEGLKRLKAARATFVNVLGHPDYYPRFGFEKAADYGLGCQWNDVPDEAFMILWLDGPVANLPAGSMIRYHAAFKTLAEA